MFRRKRLIKKVRKAIAKGNTKKAIELTIELTNKNRELSSIALKVSSRYNRVLQDFHSGKITREQSNREENQINSSILYIIEQIEDDLLVAHKKFFSFLFQLLVLSTCTSMVHLFVCSSLPYMI